jgi:hypothetical protein
VRNFAGFYKKSRGKSCPGIPGEVFDLKNIIKWWKIPHNSLFFLKKTPNTKMTIFENRALLQSQLEPGEPNAQGLSRWFDLDDRVRGGNVDLGHDEKMNTLGKRFLRMILGRGLHIGAIEPEDLVEGVYEVPEDDAYDENGKLRDPVDDLNLVDNIDVADEEYHDLLEAAPSDWGVRAVAGWAVGWLASRGYEECCCNMEEFAVGGEPTRKHEAEDIDSGRGKKKPRNA